MIRTSILIISATFLAFSTVATADSKSQFERIDADKSGGLTEVEFLGFWEKAFVNFDKDKNGEHTKDEHRHDPSFAAFDKDKDGVISPDEDRAIREMHFKGLDKDQDGSLTLAEFSNK